MTFAVSPLGILGLSLLVTLGAFTVIWAISVAVRDASIVDWWWGPGFILIAAVWWLAGRPPAGAAPWLVSAAVTLWGLRLGWHMVTRHLRKGTEDSRYARMRAERGQDFALWSLPVVFWLQAVIQWLVASPIHATLAGASVPVAWPLPGPAGVIAIAAGWLLFGTGLAMETLADYQLARFKALPENRGRLMTQGLFAIVRHPNYLGEIMLWWGLGVIAFGVSGTPLAFAGPALLTALILRLSGPPMLAPLLSTRPGYAEWVARTPAIWPFGRRG